MPSEPPFGMVFACFMVAIMIGSSMYAILLSKGNKPENALKLVLWMLTVPISVCTLMAGPQRDSADAIILYAAFLVMEVAFGIYFPAMSYLKSQIVPENHRANVMNWFRVPMNMITCSALLCMNLESFYQYLKDAFDVLYAEGETAPKMLSIGMHCRILGRPGRFKALQRFLDYVQSHEKVWVCRRADIAEHWIKHHAP